MACNSAHVIDANAANKPKDGNSTFGCATGHASVRSTKDARSVVVGRARVTAKPDSIHHMADAGSHQKCEMYFEYEADCHLRCRDAGKLPCEVLQVISTSRLSNPPRSRASSCSGSRAVGTKQRVSGSRTWKTPPGQVSSTLGAVRGMLQTGIGTGLIGCSARYLKWSVFGPKPIFLLVAAFAGVETLLGAPEDASRALPHLEALQALPVIHPLQLVTFALSHLNSLSTLFTPIPTLVAHPCVASFSLWQSTFA